MRAMRSPLALVNSTMWQNLTLVPEDNVTVPVAAPALPWLMA